MRQQAEQTRTRPSDICVSVLITSLALSPSVWLSSLVLGTSACIYMPTFSICTHLLVSCNKGEGSQIASCYNGYFYRTRALRAASHSFHADRRSCVYDAVKTVQGGKDTDEKHNSSEKIDGYSVRSDPTALTDFSSWARIPFGFKERIVFHSNKRYPRRR